MRKIYQALRIVLYKYILRRRTIFINSTSGNDNNDGLTSGAPLRTIQAAIKKIKQDVDRNGPQSRPMTIQLAGGIYGGSDQPVVIGTYEAT
jgi:hypothetical protein